MAKWLLLLVICFQFWRGRNWARILLLVMTGFALLAVFVQYWSLPTYPAGVKYQPDPMGYVLDAVAVADLPDGLVPGVRARARVVPQAPREIDPFSQAGNWSIASSRTAGLPGANSAPSPPPA